MKYLVAVLLILAVLALAFIWLEYYPEIISIFLHPVAPPIKYDYAKGMR